MTVDICNVQNQDMSQQIRSWDRYSLQSQNFWRASVPELLGLALAAQMPVAQASGQDDAKTQPLPSIVDCVVIDSDSNADDMRALTVLAGRIPLKAVIVTSGMLPASDGIEVLGRFLAPLRSDTPPRIIRGADPPSGQLMPNWSWLSRAREDMADVMSALKKALPTPLPVSPLFERGKATDAVAQAVQGCGQIGLMMLGPWTSFAAYQAELWPRLKWIVGQSRSPLDPSDPDWGRVNCSMDRSACMAGVAAIPKDIQYWIDMPGPMGPSFPVDDAMINSLTNRPLSILLRSVVTEARPWLEQQQQWDDFAAMFVVQPGLFVRKGDHYVPAHDPRQMRAAQIHLSNCTTLWKPGSALWSKC